MKYKRVDRMIYIIMALQSGDNNRISDLQKLFKCSERTIFRDLKLLFNMGINYSYDDKTKRYFLDSKLPPSDLKTNEAMGLLMMLQRVKTIYDFPFRHSILLAGLKIENLLSNDQQYLCHNLLQTVSFVRQPCSMDEISDEKFYLIQSSIAQNQIVTISYLESENNIINTELYPYHMFYCDYTWNVIGKSSHHKKTKTFQVNKIKSIKVSKRKFIAPERFDINNYIGRAWSMRPEGILYEVKLHFSADIAKDVAAVKWHETQIVTWQNDDSAIIEFRVDGLNEIIWWILSYGDKVEVIRPDELKNRIVNIAEHIVYINK